MVDPFDEKASDVSMTMQGDATAFGELRWR
jgi:hypothetical protein